MKPRVLIAVAGADTGGVAWGITQAFRRLEPTWDVRSVVRSDNYIGYPHDLAWSSKVVREVWRHADVVHYFNNFRTAALYAHRFGLKPEVITYHGTGFREDPRPYLNEQERRHAIGLVSTLDLWLLAPEKTEWLPAPYDMDWLASFREGYEPSGLIRIAHAPTKRAIKSTEPLIAAVTRLKGQGYNIELDLIEGVPWAEALRRKAQADIYFDQVLLGYGNNAVESWGMGIPVIAGAAPETLVEMEHRFKGLPFYPATEDSIADALADLVQNPKVREEWAARGNEHARKWHSDKYVVGRLKGVYQRAARGILEAA